MNYTKNRDIDITPNNNNTTINNTISKIDLDEVIPPDAVKIPINNWETKYMAEHRFRILDIHDKRKLEISYKKKDEPRKFLRNKNGQCEFVYKEINSKYDDYVIDSYYYYTKN
jgi:hypothetical protein